MVSELEGPETVGSSVRFTAKIVFRTSQLTPSAVFSISPELREAEAERSSETPENLRDRKTGAGVLMHKLVQRVMQKDPKGKK